MEDVLESPFGPQADHRKTGGLGFGADDGEVLAHEGVEQDGLADVRRAGEGDVAGSWHAEDGDRRLMVWGAKQKARSVRTVRAFKEKAGDGLLSHHLAVAVPSALQGLTAVFGMGTGVAPAR